MLTHRWHGAEPCHETGQTTDENLQAIDLFVPTTRAVKQVQGEMTP